MYQYRAIQNLKTLDKKELIELNKWLKPGWSNSNKRVYELFQFLRNLHPKFPEDKIKKDYLRKSICPNKPYSEKEILNLLSKLSTSIEDFLVHRHLRANPDLKLDLLLKIKKERQTATDKEEQLIINKIETLESKTVKSSKDLQDLIQAYQFRTELVNPKSGDINKQTDFLQIDHYLNHYYALLKARNAMELLERSSLLSEHNDQAPWYEQIPQEVREQSAIQFYAKYHRTAGKPSLRRFDRLRKTFEEILPNLPQKDRRIIYLLLVNEGARLKRAGEIKVLDKIFLLNELAVKQAIVIENDTITPHSFANILTIACQQEKFAFARTFLNNYGNFLPQVMKQDGMDWGELLINYRQDSPGTVEKAQKLSKHTKSYTVFSLRIRVLITQILFDAYQRDEVGTDERFDFHIDAFEKKLKREKTYPKKQLDGLSKFHYYAKYLAAHFRGKTLTPNATIKLEEDINTEKSLHAKAWLLSKIQEIKKGNH